MKLLKSSAGFTLVELLVSFALTGILMVGLTMFFVSALSIYTEEKAMTNAQSVSEIILDKVSGEISGAQPSPSTGTITANYSVTLSDDGVFNASENSYTGSGCISFYNRTGSRIYISSDENGRLLIHYYPVISSTQNYDAVDWTFDSAVYMDFKITDMTFDICRYDGDCALANIVRVNLTIQYKDGFTYTAHRYAECYNFTSSANMQKIRPGNVEGY